MPPTPKQPRTQDQLEQAIIKKANELNKLLNEAIPPRFQSKNQSTAINNINQSVDYLLQSI